MKLNPNPLRCFPSTFARFALIHEVHPVRGLIKYKLVLLVRQLSTGGGSLDLENAMTVFI